MATQDDNQHPGNDDNIVDADEDPKIAEIARLESDVVEEIGLGQSEGNFAYWERRVGIDRMQQGNDEAGKALLHDASEHFQDAADVMKHVDDELRQVQRLRAERQHELSRELREWTGQSLVSLGDAVRSVRTQVERMTEHDISKIVRLSKFSEEEVARKREAIIDYSQTIEITLNSVTEVRRDPLALVKALGAFTTLAFELAHYLPALMEKLEEFGRLLAQFHF